MKRILEIEIVGDHVRDEDELLERRDADKMTVRPDLSSSKLLARGIQSSPPGVAPTPGAAAETKAEVAKLYSKYKPNYADHVLSLTTKI